MIRQYNKTRKAIRNFNRKIIDRFSIALRVHEFNVKNWSRLYSKLGSIDEHFVVFRPYNIEGCEGRLKKIHDDMLQDSHYDNYNFAWVIDNRDDLLLAVSKERTKIYEKDQIKGIKALMRSHYIVTNDSLELFSRLRKKQILVFCPEEQEAIQKNEPKKKFESVIKRANHVLNSSKMNQEHASADAHKVFVDETIGSADGAIKHALRKIPVLFWFVEKAEAAAVGFEDFKKNLKKFLKNMDLNLLYIYYTATGFLRSKGINPGENAKRLYTYKDKYKGQRCFLVGNGPSLTVSDLELIQGEITFGCNRVYKMFENTTWRPTYFCMIDALIAKYSSEELAEKVDAPLFTNINTRDLMEHKPKNLIFARNLGVNPYRVSGNFEAYYVPSGATVMTFMLELAMYMGFSEIYLLGVDCTSSLSVQGHCAGGYVNQHLIQKDIERIQQRLNDPTLTAEQVAAYYFDKSTFSYKVIRDYADVHDFKIYNATRGGMLEVYERRNLNDVVGR
jgi:hypothetical protein